MPDYVVGVVGNCCNSAPWKGAGLLRMHLPALPPILRPIPARRDLR